ncbi:MAG: response regulator transcription factor [Lachnospiraceae bacterium]|nr:response regulator transcription factor [Lachnospiraceae bacterium]
MTNVLIVEDDEAISNLILINLIKEGYSCTKADDGAKAIELLETRNFDLALLDIMLPKMDGYSLLEYIKPTGTPVIFITAMGRTQDRIRGLRLGADDYIVKPFQIGELLARVEAVLRRAGKATMQYTVEDVSINLNSRTVTKNGKEIPLTVKEFDLLVEFVRNKNIALYREQLYEKVWNEPFLGETRTLDSHVKRLRQKLGWQDKIKTVFRIGYRLEV